MLFSSSQCQYADEISMSDQKLLLCLFLSLVCFQLIVTLSSVFVMLHVESYFGLPYMKCLHFVGLKCSCHFMDGDVSLLMSCKICLSISHLASL